MAARQALPGRTLWIVRALPLFLLVLTLFGFTRDDCRTCKDTGLVDCKPCSRLACVPEQGDENLLFCSEAIECKKCTGMRALPCKKCTAHDEEAATRYAEQLAANQAWLRNMRVFYQEMELELEHVESKHFKLTFHLPRFAVGAGKSHGALHVYLNRLEELFASFVADVPADPAKDFFGKTHVLLWDNGRDQERASLKYTRQPSRTQSKLMGANPVVSIHYDKSHLHEEFELHQAVVHQVTHCLLSNVFDGIWTGNIRGGWIDAGLAHYYEVSLFGGVRHYCYVEGDTMRSFKFGQWEPAVRKAVDAKDAPSFLGIATKHTTELTPSDHMFAWSYVDFVMREHPGSFAALARAIKKKKPLKEALESSLELNPFEFDTAWREFVRAKYSLKKKR